MDGIYFIAATFVGKNIHGNIIFIWVLKLSDLHLLTTQILEVYSETYSHYIKSWKAIIYIYM